jgi:hypothetical protein
MNFDRNGGVIPPTKSDLQRAKNVDLVRLPKDMCGTRCDLCKFYETIPARDVAVGIGWCIHESVDQLVSERQCCALFDCAGIIRPWLKKQS